VKYALYFYISTFPSVCAVSNTAVLCSSLIIIIIISSSSSNSSNFPYVKSV